MTRDQAREFVANNHRAVLITRRSTGGLQTSPVTVGIDSDGKWSSAADRAPTRSAISAATPPRPCASSPTPSSAPGSRSTAPPRSPPCPSMDGLIDYYRRISGEHPDWDDYRRAMVDQQRVLIRLTIDNLGPTHAG